MPRDHHPTAALPSHQRANGAFELRFGPRGRLRHLYQQAPLRVLFPTPEPREPPLAAVVNCAGGLAGGDALRQEARLEAGARATVGTAAAEKVYRSLGADTRVATRLSLEPGAVLEWLPQETILFDKCAMDRALSIELAGDAWFLGVESLVFGRRAMAEEVRHARLRDLIRVRHAGRLVLHEAIRLDGPVAAVLESPASGGGARAVATLLHAGPDAVALLDPLRGALAGYEAGASAWDGLLVARVAARDGACLRAAVVAGLAALRGGRPLPRVWQC